MKTEDNVSFMKGNCDFFGVYIETYLYTKDEKGIWYGFK